MTFAEVLEEVVHMVSNNWIKTRKTSVRFIRNPLGEFNLAKESLHFWYIISFVIKSSRSCWKMRKLCSHIALGNKHFLFWVIMGKGIWVCSHNWYFNRNKSHYYAINWLLYRKLDIRSASSLMKWLLVLNTKSSAVNNLYHTKLHKQELAGKDLFGWLHSFGREYTEHGVESLAFGGFPLALMDEFVCVYV